MWMIHAGRRPKQDALRDELRAEVEASRKKYQAEARLGLRLVPPPSATVRNEYAILESDQMVGRYTS